MSYIALRYVGRWTPGEVIREPLTDAQADHLLRVGAIRALGEEPGDAPAPAPEAPEPSPDPGPAAEAAAPEEDVPAVIDVDDTVVAAPKRRRKKQ